MRYVLIDYMHIAYRFVKATPLSATVMVDGRPKTIDTTIPNGSIKNIYRYSGNGKFMTGVFFEGGSPFRKSHFRYQEGKKGTYKEDRKRPGNPFFESTELVKQLLLSGKVSTYQVEGYEADDLIYQMVRQIKQVDPDTPIDIVTGDSDLLPLVDDQVSVYMRGVREYAEEGCPVLRKYYQVTPRNFEEYLNYTSAFKDFGLGYNNILLHKLIRGDNSDNVGMAVKGYGKKKYSKLMEEMNHDQVDYEKTFRYGNDFDTTIGPAIAKYFTEEEIERIKYNYTGLNLRGLRVPKRTPEGKIVVDITTGLPVEVGARLQMPKQIVEGYLQQALDPLIIRLGY